MSTLSLLPQVWHWIEVHTGTVNESGPYYVLWSGFGSDIGEIAIIGGLLQILHHHNCHVKGCWRIARHTYQMDGAEYKLCRKHHPATPSRLHTAEVFLTHHAAKLEGNSDSTSALVGHRDST